MQGNIIKELVGSISAILLLVSFFAIIGIAGSIEIGNIDMDTGIKMSVIAIVLLGISGLGLKFSASE